MLRVNKASKASKPERKAANASNAGNAANAINSAKADSKAPGSGKASVRGLGVGALAVAIVVIALLMLLFMRHMHGSVEATTLTNAKELSDHDVMLVQSHLDARWDELSRIGERLHAQSATAGESDAAGWVGEEGALGSFDSLFLIDDQGRLYSALSPAQPLPQNVFAQQLEEYPAESALRYELTSEEAAALGIQGFGDEGGQVVAYAAHMQPCQVGDAVMTGLVGISGIDSVQDCLQIPSFNGRGSSSVVDNRGYYLSNENDLVGLAPANSFFERLEAARDVEGGADEVIARIKRNEDFQFSWTADNGDAMISFVRPLDDTDWQFVMTVPKAVFSEQSLQLILATVIVLIGIIAVVVVFSALVARSRQKAAAAQASAQARGEFLSSMSHEIRTPLNGLVGLNYLMEQNLDDPSKMAGYVEQASGTTRYLLALVNDILDMSKLQAGKFDIACEPLSLSALVSDVCAMQQETFAAKGVRLASEVRLTRDAVLGDRTRLEQVLMNIVGNAAKFTPAGGSVTLRVMQRESPLRTALDQGEGAAGVGALGTSAPDARIQGTSAQAARGQGTSAPDACLTTVIEVEDTGCGMSPEFMERIFDPFSQERGKIAGSQKGTGLGMSISSLLVQQMGGTLTVRSRLGEGSCFTVTLPLQVAPVESSENENATHRGATCENTRSKGIACPSAPSLIMLEAPGDSECESDGVLVGEDIAQDASRTPSNSTSSTPSGTTSSADASGGRNLRVLVAEDNELNSLVLTEILRGAQMEVECAANGREALDLFAASPEGFFDVILMDVQMPVMDGCQAVRAIRGLARADAASVTIFACTANGFEEDRQEALRSGMDGFLGKPVNIKEMLRRLAELRQDVSCP